MDRKAEPIPHFITADLNLLESALARPGYFFMDKEIYPTMEEKAAVLFYSMIKNHPFPNGNKRIATTALLTFLHTNKCWLNCKRHELVYTAKRVARSKAKRRLLMEKRLTEWIKARMETNVPNSNTEFIDRAERLLKIRRPRKGLPLQLRFTFK